MNSATEKKKKVTNGEVHSLEHDVKVRIKPMVIDDLAPAFHLGEKLFTLKNLPNLYRIWDEYEIIDFYNSSSDYCLSAFVEGRLVGFLLGTVIEKTKRQKYGYLVWTGVHNDFNGMGVASALFEEFKELMIKENVSTIIVDTQADNKHAIEFFQRKGFKDPQDHVYMTMELKQHAD